MKILVSRLKANPYRHIEKYPIDRDKVKALKISIGETSFWDNILARKANGNYEIAYGHHRLIAIQELKIRAVDLPVRDLDNATMIRIMANENLENWKMSPAVINETVAVTKKFLDGELDKYKNFNEFSSGTNTRTIFQDIESEPAFRKIKGSTVGRRIITKFLGGNWKEWMVKDALDNIGITFSNKQVARVDQKAVETFPSIRQGKEFKAATRRYNIPKERHREIAKTLVKDEVPSRQIQGRVAEYVAPKKSSPKEPKAPPMLDDKIVQLTVKMNDVYTELKRVQKFLGHIQSSRIKANFNLEGKALKRITEEIF